MDEDLEEFPEIVQDPVYATVRSTASYISTDSADDLDWLEHSKLAGGIIKFLYEGSTEEKVAGLESVGLFQLNVFCQRIWFRLTLDSFIMERIGSSYSD